jgi:hypothetical protein
VRGKNRVYRPNFATFSGGKVVDLVSGTPADDAIYLGGGFARYTSVLLPLLHQETYRPRVLLFGGETAFRIDLEPASPQWQPTLKRDWSGTPPVRSFVCPVILPTGRVFFSGGTQVDGADAVRQANAERRERSTTLASTGRTARTTAALPSRGDGRGGRRAAALPLDRPAAARRRGLDGRSNGPSDVDGGIERRIEIYRPSYGSNRPTITDCPPSIGYAYSFEIETPQASSITRVALIRCGSVTHGFNPDQRYVTLPFTVKSSDTIEVQMHAMKDVLPPGNYMLWILDDQSPPRPCEWS